MDDTSHKGIPAAERDEKSPVWDMSQERVFIESLLTQRFNFFLVVFSLTLVAASNAKAQIHLAGVLTLGLLLEFALASVIARTQFKLDLIFKDLSTDPTHPVTIIDRQAGSSGSRRRLIGYWIPRSCCLVLGVLCLLAWFDRLVVGRAI